MEVLRPRIKTFDFALWEYSTKKVLFIFYQFALWCFSLWLSRFIIISARGVTKIAIFHVAETFFAASSLPSFHDDVISKNRNGVFKEKYTKLQPKVAKLEAKLDYFQGKTCLFSIAGAVFP